jgi:signal transduction histidine kinase
VSTDQPTVPPVVSGDQVTARSGALPGSVAPSKARLFALRADGDAAIRWLTPFGPLVLLVVIGSAITGHPRPGRGGEHLAVTISLAAVVVSSIPLYGTLPRAATTDAISWGRPGIDWSRPLLARLHLAVVLALIVSGGALTLLQPNGAGIAAVFVGVARLVPIVRRTRSIPIVLTVLVVIAVAGALSGRTPVSDAVLNAILLAAFFGMMFLAMRLGESNATAAQLMLEVERSRSAQAEAAGLAERQRLAREMHDVLAHSLSGLMLQLEAARMLVESDPADPRLKEAVNRAHQLGKSGLVEARRAIGMLRDDELPGPELLAGLAESFRADRDIPCELTVTGEAHPLDSQARLALYRVAQEALTNVAKHARPERVELRLRYEVDQTRLTVEDFGVPDPAASKGGPVAERDEKAETGGVDTGEDGSEDGGGYGLTGMRERAELLGGSLTTRATSGGFRVELEVPA